MLNLRPVECIVYTKNSMKLICAKDFQNKDVDIEYGYFHEWHTELSSLELYGVVETYKGKIILVPYKQISFVDEQNIVLPDILKDKFLYIKEQLQDLFDNSRNYDENYFRDNLEDLIEYLKELTNS
ncbi:hypothetical protein [Clostridium cadaveris]|uniref:hypothetical protein n=1 Tax=Clostridium cadaveris TaxID=1529 RepID=UPI0031D7EE93